MGVVLSALLAALVALVLWWPQKVWELFLDGLASFMEWIPVPDFMTNLGSFLGNIDPAIAYFVEPMQVGPGITMVLGAAVIRFIIRRIPVIG